MTLCVAAGSPYCRAVTRSKESVTGVMWVVAITWGFGDFYRPDLARAGRKPGSNRRQGRHQRVEV
jgi:hypothetical protein